MEYNMENEITGSISGYTFEGEPFDIHNTDKDVVIENGIIKIQE